VNVQIIDDSGTARFRASGTEPVAAYLLASLGISARGDAIPDDRRVSAAELVRLLDAVRTTLLGHTNAIVQAPPADPFAMRFDVLGRVLSLYPRDPDHSLVIRLADLHRSIDESARTSSPLTVYFVADFSVAQSIALATLRSQPQGLSASELRSATDIELQRRATLPDTNEDARRLYTEATRQLVEPDFSKSLALFVESGLLDRDRDTGLLRPTRKLCVVIL
jgi:hypothetical protein